MERLLIVDGSNLLFQMFYGMPSAIPGPGGRDIRGTLGFVGALLKIIRMVEPTHLAVLFDGECHNERREIDSDYKANRPDYSQIPEEETPFSQIPDLYRALDCLGICHAETETCEADDWIAGYAMRCGPRMDVVISSQDSDFFQLISRRVQILRYRGEGTVMMDEDALWEKLHVRPDQYAAYKALVGDTADNIRGVEKVGPKTASALLEAYGTLEALLERAEEIKRPSVRAAITGSRQRIQRNMALIRLEGSKQLPFELEQLVYQHSGMTTMDVLRAIGLR